MGWNHRRAKGLPPPAAPPAADAALLLLRNVEHSDGGWVIWEDGVVALLYSVIYNKVTGSFMPPELPWAAADQVHWEALHQGTYPAHSAAAGHEQENKE